MLQLIIPSSELFDERTSEFINTKECVLQLEHSLVSISKWESKWCKPFLTKQEKTHEETIDYIKCMTLTQNVDPESYYCLTKKNIEQIEKYIDSPMTATTFSSDGSGKGSSGVTTSELIYYWMITLNIPFECQKWHLNRLLTLIRVCNEKNKPPKKMSKRSVMSRNASLNAARRKQYNTNG